MPNRIHETESMVRCVSYHEYSDDYLTVLQSIIDYSKENEITPCDISINWLDEGGHYVTIYYMRSTDVA